LIHRRFFKAVSARADPSLEAQLRKAASLRSVIRARGTQPASPFVFVTALVTARILMFSERAGYALSPANFKQEMR